MKVSDEVLTVLSAATVSGNKVMLNGQLDRGLYTKTDKVLQAAGGKWSRKDKAHVFESDAETRIDQIITTGDVLVPKDDYNYFPTPAELAKRLVSEADVKEGMRVLEPSAGRGAIARAICEDVIYMTVDMVELMPENVEELKKLVVYLGNSSSLIGPTDFLTLEPNPIYDRVIMNPPFAKQADIKHVNHALKFLAPDGLLVSVMSAGVLFRENKLTTDFRKMVEDRGGYIEELPEGSFKESGTMTNTVMVVIPN